MLATHMQGAPGRSNRTPSVPLVALLILLLLGAGAVGSAAAGAIGVDTGGDAQQLPASGGVGDVAGPAAQTDNGTGADGGSQLRICDRNSSTFVSVFNEQINDVPGIVRNRVRDSNVHLQVFGTTGGNYTVVTDDQSQVVSYSEGEPGTASVKVETDCETFRAITDSGNPEATFQTAYANDEIRFIGLTVLNKVFFGAAAVASDPISLAVVLFFLALSIVGIYVFYRRLSIHYRGGESAIDPEE